MRVILLDLKGNIQYGCTCYKVLATSQQETLPYMANSRDTIMLVWLSTGCQKTQLVKAFGVKHVTS